MVSPESPRSEGRSFRVLGWAALPVLLLTGVVHVSGVGIDILLLAAAGLLLLCVERTIGDWVGEWVGPLGAAAILLTSVLGAAWFFLADAVGRTQTDRFFAEAERRGYRAAYYTRAESSAAADNTSTAAVSPAASAPIAETYAVGTTAIPEETEPSTVRRAESVQADGNRAEAALDQRNDASARRSILSWFRSNNASRPKIATEITVSSSSTSVVVGRRIVITATVIAGTSPVTSGTVDFTVNGLGAGRVQLNGRGMAATTYRTYIAGTYEIEARYSGTAEHESSRSAPVILTVTAG